MAVVSSGRIFLPEETRTDDSVKRKGRVHMKKALVWLSCTAVALSLVVGLSLGTAAAGGTDVQETFEFYKSNMTFNALWNISEGHDAIKLSIDDTDSAPNRGSGEAKGNYRCLKMELDMDEAAEEDKVNGGTSSYVAFDGKLEDKNTLIESLKKGDKNAYLSFYAKASSPVKLWVRLNVCDTIFDYIPTIDSASWKEYKIPLGEFVAWKGQESVAGVKEGETLFQVCERSGFYGTRDGEFRGIKFSVLTSDQPEDQPNGYKGTIKLDTIAFKGQYFSEDGDEDMDLDKDGKKPDNFTPATTVTTPSKGDMPTNMPAPDGDDKTTAGGQVTNETHSEPPPQSGDESTTQGGETLAVTDNTETTAGGITDAGTTGRDGTLPAEGDQTETPHKNGSLGWIIAAVVIVVLAGGGTAFYFLYWKKRRKPAPEDDFLSSDD